ncbi:hypothetical protein T439DRAFT_322301 [Meredithblackwellia eburnea MCA 4105]
MKELKEAMKETGNPNQASFGVQMRASREYIHEPARSGGSYRRFSNRPDHEPGPRGPAPLAEYNSTARVPVGTFAYGSCRRLWPVTPSEQTERNLENLNRPRQPRIPANTNNDSNELNVTIPSLSTLSTPRDSESRMGRGREPAVIHHQSISLGTSPQSGNPFEVQSRAAMPSASTRIHQAMSFNHLLAGDPSSTPQNSHHTPPHHDSTPQGEHFPSPHGPRSPMSPGSNAARTLVSIATTNAGRGQPQRPTTNYSTEGAAPIPNPSAPTRGPRRYRLQQTYPYESSSRNSRRL